MNVKLDKIHATISLCTLSDMNNVVEFSHDFFILTIYFIDERLTWYGPAFNGAMKLSGEGIRMLMNTKRSCGLSIKRSKALWVNGAFLKAIFMVVLKVFSAALKGLASMVLAKGHK